MHYNHALKAAVHCECVWFQTQFIFTSLFFLRNVFSFTSGLWAKCLLKHWRCMSLCLYFYSGTHPPICDVQTHSSLLLSFEALCTATLIGSCPSLLLRLSLGLHHLHPHWDRAQLYLRACVRVQVLSFNVKLCKCFGLLCMYEVFPFTLSAGTCSQIC